MIDEKMEVYVGHTAAHGLNNPIQVPWLINNNVITEMHLHTGREWFSPAPHWITSS